MRYEFRDTPYQGLVIRHIKAVDLDSHGPFIAPVTQLHVIRRFLERTHPALIVVVMTGQGRVLTTRSELMQAFEQVHPCQPDSSYTWQATTYESPSYPHVE